MFVVVFTFYVFAMKPQRSLKSTLIHGIGVLSCMVFIFWFTAAQSTWNSLTAQLEAAKNIAISNLDSTTTQFSTEHFSGSQNMENNANYQSLACLWVLEQTQPSQWFANAVADLRTEILQDYLDLDQDIKRISLWILVDQNRLQSDIANFTALYATRVNQLINNYTQQLQDMQSQVAGYTQANQPLLADLNNKVMQLNNIHNQYTSLQDLVFQFNNLLLAQEGNVIDAISEQKSQAVAFLEQRLDQAIKQELARSNNILWLQAILNQRKRDVVRLYRLDFDDAMDEIVGNRYSPQAHDTLKEQIQTIRQTFYQDQKLRCENILTAGMDVDGYAKVVLANINDMNNRLAIGVSALKATGSSQQIKQSMFRTFQWLYKDRIDEEFVTMRRFAGDQLNILRDRAMSQNEELTALQEQKSSYDAMQAGAEKDQRKQSLIAQARPLYDQAASKTIQTAVKSILESLGVDLTPPAQDVDGNEVQTDNQFFPIIVRMANRYESPTIFATMMQAALSPLQDRLDAAGPAQRVLLQQVMEAIQLYIAQ